MLSFQETWIRGDTMNKRISFRHMEHSPTLEGHAQEQLKKIEDFLAHEREPIDIELVFEPHHLKAHHHVHLIIKTAEYNVIVDRYGPHMYQVLDDVLDAAYLQLRKEKEKWVDKHKHGCVQQCVPGRTSKEDYEGELEDMSEEEIRDIEEE